VDVPADTINLEASSKVILRYITSSIGNISKKPLVGFGVVGTKTLIKSFPVFCAISPLFSFVAKPTAHTPFLGYSINTTLFFASSFFENMNEDPLHQVLHFSLLLLSIQHH